MCESAVCVGLGSQPVSVCLRTRTFGGRTGHSAAGAVGPEGVARPQPRSKANTHFLPAPALRGPLLRMERKRRAPVCPVAVTSHAC